MPTDRIVFDHIACATHRIADAPAFLSGVLGGASGWGSPSPEFRWWHWDFEGGGRIEVLEPDASPRGFVRRFLDARGPGIHHVTFKVPDIHEVCDRARSHGYDVVGFDDSNPGWKEAFLHPKQAMGIVVQFAEQGEDDDDQDYEPPADLRPAEPSDPPPSVTIVGVRMVSGEAERARRQWSGVLQGEAERRDGEILFTWPGSPMRVAVTIQRGAEDRSEAIEVRADRRLELPDGPQPVLGARFTEVA